MILSGGGALPVLNAGNPNARGPELITNGDFAGGATGWVSGSSFTSTAAVTGGEMQVTPTADFGRQLQGVTVEIGARYEVSALVRRVSGSTGNAYVAVAFGSSQGDTVIIGQTTSATLVPVSAIVTATNTNMNVSLAGRLGDVGGFDNVSVRRVY